MLLVVKRQDELMTEFRTDKNEIYIGRRPDNQVCLPNPSVSKQHALIFQDDHQQWMVRDLDSANKTYVNDQAVYETQLNHGDKITIVEFTIEVVLEEAKAPSQDELSDTIVHDTRSQAPQIIIRKPGAEQAPVVRFPAQRIKDMLNLTDKLAKADTAEKVLLALLDGLMGHLNSYQIWGALRTAADGPMVVHGGKDRGGAAISQEQLFFNDRIAGAIEKEQYQLFIFSRDMNKPKEKQTRSIVIAPILNSDGCFGVLYSNNTFRDDHYSLSDLDYLMMLSFHAACILQKM